MKCIILTQRQDYESVRKETRDAVDIAWHYLLQEIGILTILMLYANYKKMIIMKLRVCIYYRKEINFYILKQ